MDDVNENGTLLTIGELARRTGMPVKTIRYYADIGLVPPTERSHGGYRLYDAAAVAQLDLVRTLRELDVDLPSVRTVLERTVALSDVAATHAAALDAQIRILTVRRSVLRAVAQLGIDDEKEVILMNKLAKLSAAERQRIIDEYWEETFEGLDVDPQFAAMSRSVKIELPEDPSPEQVDAWIELAELVQDPDYRARVRQMAQAGHDARTSEEQPAGAEGQAAGAEQQQELFARVTSVVQPLREAGVAPESAEAAAVIGDVAAAFAEARGETDTPDFRVRLADEISTFSDQRVERFWELIGIVNGWPAQPQHSGSVATMEWFASALRASHS